MKLFKIATSDAKKTAIRLLQLRSQMKQNQSKYPHYFHYCLHLCLHIKIICRRFYIISPFTFWDMRTLVKWNVSLKTFRNNRICSELAYFLRNLQNLHINNFAKIAGYCLYMNTNIYRNFQICISVHLSAWARVLDQFLIFKIGRLLI